MKKYYFSIVFLILLNCKPKDKFSWNAGFSAPKNYVAGGPFVEYFYKGKSVAGTSSNVGINPGWGINSGGYTGGEKYKEVPDSVAVSWRCGFDLINYKGGLKLPREKMLNIFKEKTIDTHADYSIILAGMAPGGNVTIWMQGTKTSKEIVKFKANIISKDNKYDENSISLWTSTGEEAKDILKYIKIHGIPYSVWDKGEREYNYYIGFSSKEDNKFKETITSISKDGSYIFFNQDETIVSYQDWKNNNFKSNKKRGKLPIHVIMQWISPNKERWYKGEIVFPQNFQTIYENFYSKYKTANIIFVMDKIDQSADYTFGSVWLQSPLIKEEVMKFRLAKLEYQTRKYSVSKYSLPKGFVFPKWEGREKPAFPELDFWQEK